MDLISLSRAKIKDKLLPDMLLRRVSVCVDPKSGFDTEDDPVGRITSSYVRAVESFSERLSGSSRSDSFFIEIHFKGAECPDCFLVSRRTKRKRFLQVFGPKDCVVGVGWLCHDALRSLFGESWRYRFDDVALHEFCDKELGASIETSSMLSCFLAVSAVNSAKKDSVRSVLSASSVSDALRKYFFNVS